MLHAQWVERKHFGSWIQPLEPSVEDSDRLGYLGFQNSSILNPIPKAICGDFYRTVLAKHLFGFIIYISSAPPEFSKFEYSKLFWVVSTSIPDSLQDCQQALVKALECRGTCESVAQRVQQEEPSSPRSRVLEQSRSLVEHQLPDSVFRKNADILCLHHLHLCFQSAKSTSPFFRVSMSRRTRTAQKLQLKPSRNWPKIGTLLPKLRSQVVALRDSAAVASKSSSQSPQSPLRFSSAALCFVLDSVHLWVARRFPSGFHEFSFLVLRVGLQPLRRNRPSCWHRLWKNRRNWALAHKDSLKVSLV